MQFIFGTLFILSIFTAIVFGVIAKIYKSDAKVHKRMSTNLEINLWGSGLLFSLIGATASTDTKTPHTQLVYFVSLFFIASLVALITYIIKLLFAKNNYRFKNLSVRIAVSALATIISFLVLLVFATIQVLA